MTLLSASFEYPLGSGNRLSIPTGLAQIVGGYRIDCAGEVFVDVPTGYDVLTDKGFIGPNYMMEEGPLNLQVVVANTTNSFTPLGGSQITLSVANIRQYLVLSVETRTDTRDSLVAPDGSITKQAHTEPFISACVLQSQDECGLKYILPFATV